MPKLGVNIDHIATLRQARGGLIPDPVEAAVLVELAGADGIVAHLREDRRHIQDCDVYLLRKIVKTKLNLEMAANEEIIKIALDVLPDSVCLVPEHRQELTTEGGLDVAGQEKYLLGVVERLKAKGIVVSLFVDPEEKQVVAAARVKADVVELHTGNFAEAKDDVSCNRELARIKTAGKKALELGLRLNAGHGLDYRNAGFIAMIEGVEELNIGFSIISRAIYVGIAQAVKEMRKLVCSPF
ncbi:MAG: pyridoxine 5'-phosphate synthase [Elusimicrobiota bacterium]